MKCKIPYGKQFIEYECDNIVTSSIGELKNDKSEKEIVKEALLDPLSSPTLEKLAVNKKDCTILISDHTRPVPSKIILPPMLEELRKGNPDIKITLLVATGNHRLSTQEELRKKLGDDIFEKETIKVHDCTKLEDHVQIGILPSGAKLLVDKTAVEAELLIAEGFIEPHFFAGYSGGRKSVLPGICYMDSVKANHCGSFIDSPFARTGILENNPINIDMEAAARLIKLSFILNVIIDADKKIVSAFAGDPIAAHHAGASFLSKFAKTKAIFADTVITSNGGYPLDQNIYQCVKSLTAAEACANEGADIIILAECADGIGGEGFYNSLKNCNDIKELYDSYVETKPENTINDQWQTQILLRILLKHRVIFVTRPQLKEVIEDMKMTYAYSLDDALELTKGKIAVIPDGVSLIIEN